MLKIVYCGSLRKNREKGNKYFNNVKYYVKVFFVN